MSDHNYVPSSKLGKWFNDRLPLLSLSAHLSEYPTPKNLNYWWTFGGILTFCLVAQIITGIVLAMHYVAHTDLAFAGMFSSGFSRLIFHLALELAAVVTVLLTLWYVYAKTYPQKDQNTWRHPHTRGCLFRQIY